MTFTDEILVTQETKNTSRFGAASLAAALTLALVPAYAQTSAVLVKARQQFVPYHHVDETSHTTEIDLTAGHAQIFTQLNRIYDYLLTRRTELDKESHLILYSNLWKLYE